MDAAVFGLIVADVVARPMDLTRPPSRGGLTVLDSLALHTGGNACNVAVAMAKLGMRLAAAGLIGDDMLGTAVVERLKQAGVDVSQVAGDARAQTSATVVAVDSSGERCFFHVPGVTSFLDAAAFRRCFELFRECAWLHIGYFGLLPEPLVRELPELLRELRTVAPGTRVAMDTSHPPAERAMLDPILPHLDLFAPSRPEAVALTGEREPARMVASFRARMSTNAIIGIKLDSDGCRLDDGQQAFSIPAYAVDVIDTTGAGDAWFAGLLTGLRKRLSLIDCGRLANRVAADCCSALGASTGVQRLDDTVTRV